jgi:hypothetical protein
MIALAKGGGLYCYHIVRHVCKCICVYISIRYYKYPNTFLAKSEGTIYSCTRVGKGAMRLGHQQNYCVYCSHCKHTSDMMVVGGGGGEGAGAMARPA